MSAEFFKCIVFFGALNIKQRAIYSHYLGEKADNSMADITKKYAFLILRLCVPSRLA